MQDNVSVLIATIMFVIIIVLFPIYNVANRQDSVANNIVVEATTSFVDDVRTQGYIKGDEYQEYINKINATGNFFEVELEVHRKIIIKDKNGNYVDDYEIIYTEDILKEIESRVQVEGATSDTDALNTVSNTLHDKNSIEVTGVCLLNEGDKVYARVKNTNMTQAQVLLQNLFSGSQEARILVNYGGEIYGTQWVKSDLVESVAANISLSRPMKEDGEEYIMRAVAMEDGEEGGELEYIYGIAVPINSKSDVIRFNISYSNTQSYLFTIPDGSTTVLSPENYITLEGFTGNIEITKVRQDATSAVYKVLIDNIKIPSGLEESTCQIRVKEGTAIASNGERVGSIVSTEFIIYQPQDNFEIGDLIATQDIYDNEYHEEKWYVNASGYAKLWNQYSQRISLITFTLPEQAKDGRKIKEYIWTLSNIGGAPEISDNNLGYTWLSDKNNRNIPSLIKTTAPFIVATFKEEVATEEDIKNGLAKGNYVKVKAVDEDGNYSKTKGVAFATIDNYMNKTISNYTATVRTLKMTGATVESATFSLFVRNNHSTSGVVDNGDRFRIIGIDHAGRQVILIDKTIESVTSLSGNQASYAAKIKLDNEENMYYIDDNNNGSYNDGEYYLANDIEFDDNRYNSTLGFKTKDFGYPSSDPNAEDRSLYYWVVNKLDKLGITIKQSAKKKYISLIFDYKILAGHTTCLNEAKNGTGNISCTVVTDFND